MNRQLTHRACLALVALAFLATALPAAAASYYYTFEDGLAPWIKGNDPGAAASSLILSNWDSFCPVGGVRHARLTVAAPYTPWSTIWMQAPFAARNTVQVNVKWVTKDQGHCQLDCYAVVYVGTAPPGGGAAFTTLGGVGANWTSHSYSAVIPACTVRKLHPPICWRSGNITAVVVDDAAEHISAFHLTFLAAALNRYRTALLNALVRARSVVILNVFQHNSS